MTVDFNNTGRVNDNFQAKLLQPQANQRQKIVASQSVKSGSNDGDSFSTGLKVAAGVATVTAVGAALRHGHLNGKLAVKAEETGFINGVKKYADKAGAGVTDAVAFVKNKLGVTLSKNELTSQITRTEAEGAEIVTKTENILKDAGDKADDFKAASQNFTTKTEEILEANNNVIEKKRALNAAAADAKNSAKGELEESETALKDLKDGLADTEEAQALKELSPELYELQTKALNKQIKLDTLKAQAADAGYDIQ